MTDIEDRRLWLALEAVVGLPAIALDHLDDGVAELAAHEPSEAALRALGAAVPPAQVDALATLVEARLAAEWKRRLEGARPARPARTPLPAGMPVAELLARRAALLAEHAGIAQFHRELADELAEDVLRAQVEDMEALAVAMSSPIDDDDEA